MIKTKLKAMHYRISSSVVLVANMVITYVIGFKTSTSFNNYKNIMKELEEKNKCEDDKCCGCKYCNKNE